MIRVVFFIVFFLCYSIGYAETTQTKRIPEFSNDRVNVWKTVIYPSKASVLKMHRHEYDRVVVALTDGVLKVTNDKNKVHYLKLQQGKSYYLPKDPKDELHMDENITKHPIDVIVIELRG